MPRAHSTGWALRASGAPEDVSVVGYDNTGLSAMHHIGLTTIDQPRSAMGREAFRTLLERISGSRSTALDLLVSPTLVVRRNDGPPTGGRGEPRAHVGKAAGAAMTVRIGIIGTSWWADAMYLPALADHPDSAITAICGRDHRSDGKASRRAGASRRCTRTGGICSTEAPSTP